jgi:hypothetical protein
MKAVIMQPTYLPWIGYFGMIDIADVFVFYDDVQFEKQSWQQRNKIKTSTGDWMWLSVPIIRNFGQIIKDTQINNSTDWKKDHWQSIHQTYAKAPFFKEYQSDIENIYLKEWEYICDLNINLICRLSELLNIRLPHFVKSSEIQDIDGRKTDRLFPVLEQIGAYEYITSPGTKNYLEINKFKERGIKVYWYEFQHPKYPQNKGDFIPYLSIIDLLFNTGNKSGNYIREGAKDSLKLDSMF